MSDEPLTIPELTVVRTTLLPCEVRNADDGEPDGLGELVTRFSPFGSWYRIDSFWEGSFLERSVPAAFKQTISAHNKAQRVDAHQIRTMFNHGMDMQIDSKLLGDVIDARIDDDSPVTVTRLWDTSYNRDLLPGLRSGAYGSSFMFRVVKDEWNNEPGASEHNPDGLPERTLKEVRVFEAGPVTWPANPAATAGMRSLSGTDAYYEFLARRDPERVGELRSQIVALHPERAAIGTREAAGAALQEPSEPAPGHSGGLTHAQRARLLHFPSRKD
jgi:phage head maturation protease